MALISLAIFARALGIDHDLRWGRGRVLSALAGAGLVLFALLIAYYPQAARRAALLRDRVLDSCYFRSLSAWSAAFPPFMVIRKGLRWVSRWKVVAYFNASPGRVARLLAVMSVIVLAGAYLWYATAGNPAAWSPGSSYFDRQAQAFLHGQLALLDRPDPRLVELSNPYDYQQRASIPVIWDVSFYHGNYYLYWGPTPALVAALFRIASPGWLDDSSLSIIFEILTLAACALLLVNVRQRCFPEVSGWAVLPPLILAGAANPVIYVLNRPSVYEAAITGGQAFFIFGLVFAWLGITAEKPRAGYLSAAGGAFILAAASRLNLAPVIAWAATVICAVLFFQKTPRSRFRSLAALLIPILIGAALLGWYNFARFGSVLESGIHYQLTGPFMPSDYSLVFSPRYLLANFYTYLFRPLSISPIFPFVSAPWVKEISWPFFIHLPPSYYYSEPVSGMLLAAPLIWLVGLLPAAWLGRAFFSSSTPGGDWSAWQGFIRKAGQPDWGWLAVILSGAAVLELGVMLLFFCSSMRYELDILPTLALLAGLGTWFVLGTLRKKPGWWGLFVIGVLILSFATLGIGFLMGFSGYNNHFEAANPGLYYSLMHFFYP